MATELVPSGPGYVGEHESVPRGGMGCCGGPVRAEVPLREALRSTLDTLDRLDEALFAADELSKTAMFVIGRMREGMTTEAQRDFLMARLSSAVTNWETKID